MTLLAEPIEQPAPHVERRTELKGALRDQWSVAAGQLTAGAGNLAFVLVLARVLAPAAFAHATAWMALFLLVNLPAASLGAGAALNPSTGARLSRRSAKIGAIAGAAVMLSAPLTAGVLHLSTALVLALGLAVPLAGPLAVARGRLYGRDHRRLVTSFLVEPALRLVLGAGLAVAAGAGGAVAAVLVAGAAAYLIAARRPSSHRPHLSSLRTQIVSATAQSTRVAPQTGATVVVFLLLAVVQNQDLVFANALLRGAQAGSFAALSTLGGIAALATVTVPLVLLSRAGSRRSDGLMVALATAAVLGAAAVAAVLVGGTWAERLLFGGRYASISRLALPYVAAMALFGTCRVLIADRCASGRARPTAVLLATVAAGQALLIAVFGTDPARIAASTLAACAALAAGLLLLARPRPRRMAVVGGATAEVVAFRTRPEPVARPLPEAPLELGPGPAPAGGDTGSAPGQPARRPRAATHYQTLGVLAGLSVAALAVRLIVPRGLWLDEATSILEARLSFPGLLHMLGHTDVHPPLYLSVLWVSVRTIGTGETAVRVPSILAGVAVVPAAYVTARDLYDRRTGVVAAALSVVAPLLVWYSQEARMYSFFMLFALLSIWGQIRALRWGRTRDWAIWVVASALLAWNEYFGLLQIASQLAAFAWVAWLCRGVRDHRRYLLGWAAATLALALLVVPLGPFAHHQFVVNQRAGKGFGSQIPSQAGNGASSAPSRGLSVYSLGANLIWALWGYHADATIALIGALWPLAMLGSLILLGRRRRELTTVVLLSVVGPTATLFGLGLLKPDLFDVRYIAGVVVLLVILVARAVTGLSKTAVSAAVVTVVLLATNGVALADQQLNGANPRRYDFRAAFAHIKADSGPGDVVLYDPSYLNPVLGYYAPGVAADPIPGPAGDAAAARKVFVLATPRLFKGNPDYSALGDVLAQLRQHRVQVSETHWPNVVVWEYQ